MLNGGSSEITCAQWGLVRDNTCSATQEGEELMSERPDLSPIVQPKLDEINQQWLDLEDTTKQKGQKLFDANRHILYEQSCDDIDGWINEIESQIVTEDVGHDLTTVNLLVKKQNVSDEHDATFKINLYDQFGDVLILRTNCA